jgi:transposase
VIPARLRVVVTKRLKLACRACPGVVLQASAPARLIEGGVPTEATVAHVLVSRYADHLPLYRQAQILARQSIEIGREVLADWTGRGALEIVPLVRRMREILLASPRLFANETTMPVLDPGRGKTKKGYAWAIARDDRPWGGANPPAAVFHYAPGRGAEHAKDLLAGHRGVLQCDGYGAYKALAAASEGITLAFCWSHVWRGFIELAKGKTAPIAAETLQRVATLFTVEADVRGKPPDIRRIARQQPDCGGDPLRAEPPRRSGAVPRGWQDRARHEHGRARHPPDLPQPQKCAVRLRRRWRCKVGGRRLAGGNGQAQRR